MDKSLRNSRIVMRSRFSAPGLVSTTATVKRDTWNSHTIRTQFVIGLTAKKQKRVSIGNILPNNHMMNSLISYPEIDRPLDDFIQFNFPQIAVALP